MSLCKIVLQQPYQEAKGVSLIIASLVCDILWLASTIRAIRDSEMAFIERLVTLAALENLKLYVKESGLASWIMIHIFPSHPIALSACY